MYGGSYDNNDNKSRIEEIREAVQRAREAALKRAQQLGGFMNNNNKRNTNVERRRATSTERRRTTSVQRKRNTSAERRRSTSAQRRRATSTERKRNTSAQRRRSTSAQRRRSTSAQRRRSTSAQRKRNTSAQRRRSTSAQRRRVTSTERRRSTSAQRRRATSIERRQIGGGGCGLANRDLLGGAKVRRVAKKLAAKKNKKVSLRIRSRSPKRKVTKRKITKRKVTKRKVSKKLMKKVMKKVKKAIKKPRKASTRTYVAYICKGSGAKKLLTSPVGDKSKIYFHGLPSAAARKVLTALTKKRKLSKGRYTSIYTKNALTGSKNAVRICLHEVTKGLHGLDGEKFQYEYFGWNQKCAGKSITLSHKDSRGRKVTNTFTPKFKHMVVRVTEKAKTLQSALAKARTKATRAKRSFAKSRKGRRSTRK
jgi:hypothetical protein